MSHILPYLVAMFETADKNLDNFTLKGALR